MPGLPKESTAYSNVPTSRDSVRIFFLLAALNRLAVACYQRIYRMHTVLVGMPPLAPGVKYYKIAKETDGFIVAGRDGAGWNSGVDLRVGWGGLIVLYRCR